MLIHKITGNASVFTGRLSSPSAMVIHKATESVYGTVIQDVPRRKRTQSSIQSNIVSGDDADRKRPRCTIKEIWKARETRESRKKIETKPSQILLKLYRKEQTYSMSHDSGRGEIVGKEFDIEDVHFGENSSLQYFIT